MVEINGTRLLRNLTRLREFGATGTGVVRPTFSDQDMAARQWLANQMTSAGLEAQIDGAANVFGRSNKPGPALIIGSHSDTQPRGGWLDGAMGVMYAIEIAQVLAENQETSDLAIDTVAWSDEEGSYTSCLGAKSFVGELTDSDLAATNSEGESVAEALERVGLSTTPRLTLDPSRHIGYLEAHIEQGPHLEDQDLLIGVVTSIVGIRGFKVAFVGEQNHAGTTPMDRRKDAGVALFHFGVTLRERLAAVAGPNSVWTIGNAVLEPGAESIIPGYAELILQMRDPDDATLDLMANEVVGLAAEMSEQGPVRVEAKPTRDAIRPTVMDPGLRRHIGAAAKAVVGAKWMEMPSAAGHDPMVLSHHLPCAMLFIPSIGGVSHDFAEDSKPEDIVTGCQVLADAAVSVLRDRV